MQIDFPAQTASTHWYLSLDTSPPNKINFKRPKKTGLGNCRENKLFGRHKGPTALHVSLSVLQAAFPKSPSCPQAAPQPGHLCQEGPDLFLQTPFAPHSCFVILRRGNCPQAGKATQGGLFNLWRRAISSINTLQFETESRAQGLQYPVSTGICIRSLLTLAEPCGSAPLWAWTDLLAEALGVQPPAPHGDLTSQLHWAGQGRCSTDKLCPGRWQKLATFILGHLCPQNRQSPPSNYLYSLWTQEKRCARITLPSHHPAVMVSKSPVHLQSAMK